MVIFEKDEIKKIHQKLIVEQSNNKNGFYILRYDERINKFDLSDIFNISDIDYICVGHREIIENFKFDYLPDNYWEKGYLVFFQLNENIVYPLFNSFWNENKFLALIDNILL